MKIFLTCVILLVCAIAAGAQVEMEDGPETTNRWAMISFHYVQTPQFHGNGNTGFGIQTFFKPSADRRLWLGGGFMLTGVDRRRAVIVGPSAGAWIVGNGRLGVFSYLMSGLNMSSNSGLTGLNFFTDPSLTFGWASQLGIGGCVEIATNIRLHLTGIAMHITNEQGATPLGVQAGILLGGR